MPNKFFKTPAEFRDWLEQHHSTAKELTVGFYKKGSGKPSLTWPESVDQALCFGWIDGVRKRVDDDSYSIRFTPRRPKSTWSTVNLKRAAELSKLGLMRPAGLQAFEARDQARSGAYSYEQRRNPTLGAAYERQLRANQKAWAYFQAQPPWYRKAAVWWVICARQEATRLRRLAALIADSAQGRPIAPLARRPAPK